MKPKNPFNPQNIEPGDRVRLATGDKRDVMEVISVAGSHENKVYCKELGREFYATCFELVEKAVLVH